MAVGGKTGGGGAAAPPEEAEVAQEPVDPPAGGLDMPPPRPSLEVEAFPGESQLSEDERNRWLVLHFALPRTIMTCDMAMGRSTEAELNDALSSMAWGSVDGYTREWTLESEDPSLEPPHPAWISYAEYVSRMYPSDHTMEEEAREENTRMAAQKRAVFTNPGEPGLKFRAMLDQMVKNLMHSNKALAKAFDIKKVILDEKEVPEDEAKSEAQNIMRYGRHQVLPAFWQLLTQLTRRGRRFSVVFRTFSEEQLSAIKRELQLFCEGHHPAYSGQNKTVKPPPMNGDKGSRDFRLSSAGTGRFDRMGGSLEFAERPVSETEPGPTVYSFPPYHEVYAGLMNHILEANNTAAIVDDLAYWEAKDRQAEGGKLLLVDYAGGFAETKVQHIFFDGNIQRGDAFCVDVRDVVSGEPISFKEVDGVFLHRVDLFQAVTDIEYFTKAVDACDIKMSQRILESRRSAASLAAAEEAREVEAAAVLPPKEYLYRNVIPALLPALEACQRDRPADPLEYIAFYMLRHSKQYSKTLKA